MMKPFDVYPLYPIEPIKAKACKLWDVNGNEFLDFYGGHAVISIGHGHPKYLKALREQMEKIGFYSNSVINSLQNELAETLGRVSGYDNYKLFMSNSGAEANENALKLASFHTGKRKVIAFKRSFHGRTSGAVACTDNPTIISPFNSSHEVEFAWPGEIDTVRELCRNDDISAIIIEGVQGVGGIHIPDTGFMLALRQFCSESGIVLILDEIQSGYGRTGKFFAHQHFGIKPDIITVAKGMGNGFPIGGTLISPAFKEVKGILGTTFGGNHLACAASLAVLEVLMEEQLIKNVVNMGKYLKYSLQILSGIAEVRALGLMVALEFNENVKKIREQLLFEKKIFTGISGTNIIRLLPPLCISEKEIDLFVDSIKTVLSS